MKENKGITLIALMVTVIILLVLAAITISTVNDGEIIGKAENEYNSVDNLASKYNELLKGEGDFLNETYNGIGGHEHIWGEIIILTEPTCIYEGTGQKICEICSAKDPTSIEPLGHDLTTTITKAATCTATGTITEKCQRSGCTYSDTTTTAKLGHNWTLLGFQQYVADGQCTDCADYRTSHRHIIKYECSRCGQKENYAQGHYPKFTYVWDWDGLNVPYFMCVCGLINYYGDETFSLDYFDFWCSVSNLMYVENGRFDRTVYDNAAAKAWDEYWSEYCDGTVGIRYNYS